MTLRITAAVVGALSCTALALPSSAPAAEVLKVSGDRVTRTGDPFVPDRARSGLGPAPRARRSGAPAARASSSSAGQGEARARSAAKKRGVTRGPKTVARALARARRAHRISGRTARRYRRLYDRARSTRRRLRGARGRELGSVIAALEAIARRRQLVPSRMKPLFLTLRRNLEYWPRKRFPANRSRVTFGRSELVFEYYRGRGLQIQPLVNFKKANLMHGACVKDTGRPCRHARLRSLLSELTKVSSRRSGSRAWEYFFSFGGGRPPWVSGMAQAVGIQAYARAAQLLGDRRYLRTARDALGVFERPPPAGVATRGPLGGTHYLQYSFAPRLFIFNAFLGALVGLYDYAEITGDRRARRLFVAAEPEAAAEVPWSDTGDWSRYTFRGQESTREYHELLRELLASSCSRLRTPVYCQTARRFRAYATEPPRLVLLGPQLVTQGRETRVSFSLSKLSAVQLTITRNGQTAFDRVLTFRAGGGSFAWTPRAAGAYSVRLGGKELRTGQELRTRTTGQIQSLPAP